MDEITVGPRHYPPTLWYNVIEIHNLLQQNHLKRRNEELLNHFVLLMHAIQR